MNVLLKLVFVGGKGTLNNLDKAVSNSRIKSNFEEDHPESDSLSFSVIVIMLLNLIVKNNKHNNVKSKLSN